MFNYRKPGVYFERLDRLPFYRQVRTDIAGFVGIARRGPLHRAVKLESWQQFFSVFGGISRATPSYLGYAVRGFFENGGRECWVVRVADPLVAQPAAFAVYDDVPDRTYPLPKWGLMASSPGMWGRELQVEMRRTGGNQFNLTIRLPQGDGEVRQVWTNLPFEDVATLRKRIEESEIDVQSTGADEPSARRQSETRRRLERLVNVVDGPSLPGGSDLNRGVGGRILSANWVSARGLFTGGNSGLSSLNLAHFTGKTASPESKWGLAVLEDIDEISILTMPDMMPVPHNEPTFVSRSPAPCDDPEADDETAILPVQDVPVEYPPGFNDDEIRLLQFALVEQCERRLDRFAILDVPPNRRFPDDVIAWRDQFETNRAALYYPWVKVLRPHGGLIDVPVCGHVAGIYARGDTEIGVHKPPANMVMDDLQDVAQPVDDNLHGLFNEHQVNVLRAYPGRGIRIGGAVTLSNVLLLRYINVRRLLLWIEEVIDKSVQVIVFEPNNQELWSAIERIGRGFLDGIWRDGMLDGASADAAYSIRCDATTNPPEDTDRGLIQCEIRLLPPYPAEYVLVRIGKVSGGSELAITESRSDRRS